MSKEKRKPTKEPQVPFEEAIRRLETIVAQLEEGETPLERSLELFEDGVRLSRSCLQRLDAAERRIEMLTRDEGTGVDRAVPFEPGEEE